MSRYEATVVPYVHALRESTFSYDSLCEAVDKHLRLNLGRRVLSLGCGTCSLEVRLARLGYSIRALDIDPGSIEFARHLCSQYNVQVDVEVADAREPLPFETFDAIIALYTEFTLHELRSLAARAVSVARPGTLFIANVPCSDDRTIGQVVSFIDILDQGTAVCLSEYHREDHLLRGEEVYLVDRGDGVAQLRRDATRVPLACNSPSDVRAAVQSWEQLGWTLDNLISMGAFCPSAAPPFCDQVLAVWRFGQI